MTSQRSLSSFVIPSALVLLATGVLVLTLANPGFQRAVHALLPAPQFAPAQPPSFGNQGTVGRDWKDAGTVITTGYRGNGLAKLSNAMLPAGFQTPRCDDGQQAQYRGAYDLTGPNALGQRVSNRRFVFDCPEAAGGIAKSIEKVMEWIGRGGQPPLPPAMP